MICSEHWTTIWNARTSGVTLAACAERCGARADCPAFTYVGDSGDWYHGDDDGQQDCMLCTSAALAPMGWGITYVKTHTSIEGACAAIPPGSATASYLCGLKMRPHI